MSRISIGVLGLGRMGRLHARVLRDLSDHFEWVGAFDPAETSDFADAQSLIERATTVVIAAPTALHAGLARAAIDAGRHLLIEKPITATASEARRLMAAAEARGVRVFAGHSERFNPVVRALRSLLVSEVLEAIELVRTVPAPHAGAVSSDVLLNLGVHDFDLVEHLTGKPAELEDARGSADGARVRLVAGPTRATLHARRDGAPTRAIRVTTARTVYEGNLLSPRLTMQKGGARAQVTLERHEPLVAQALALHAALTGAAAPIATGAEGARAVDLAERAIRARDAGAGAEAAAGA